MKTNLTFKLILHLLFLRVSIAAVTSDETAFERVQSNTTSEFPKKFTLNCIKTTFRPMGI